VIALSTALSNANDLADWLGVKEEGLNKKYMFIIYILGLFNFRADVRPVPTTVHIQSFAGRHFCPRMATMNRPVYQAIRDHSSGFFFFILFN
jgi:replicative superfamily II helicase